LVSVVYCITLIRKRHGHLGIHDVARLPSRLVFNPLTPSLGGDKRELGTPQTPAAFCCTVPCHSRRGGNPVSHVVSRRGLIHQAFGAFP
jgi:hypothetical protein